MTSGRTTSESGGVWKPPQYDKDKFSNWKLWMQVYMNAVDDEIFEIVQNGPYIPFKRITKENEPDIIDINPKEKWSESEKRKVNLDKRAKSILYSSLDDNVFESVVNCYNAKAMSKFSSHASWRTEEVKENKQSILVQKYEMFLHISGEDVSATYERLNILANQLKTFGKTYSNKDLCMKLMRARPGKWDAKTTAIRESKNLSTMTIQMLYWDLLTYELELTQKIVSFGCPEIGHPTKIPYKMPQKISEAYPQCIAHTDSKSDETRSQPPHHPRNLSARRSDHWDTWSRRYPEDSLKAFLESSEDLHTVGGPNKPGVRSYLVTTFTWSPKPWLQKENSSGVPRREIREIFPVGLSWL